MADGTRAEQLVQTMEREPAFQQEVEAAPTVAAKRTVLDTHGFQDVSLDDMKVYVESQGGTLVLPPQVRELSDEELDAVVGGGLSPLDPASDAIIAAAAAAVA